MPSADSASEIVKFTISIPRESCTNAKAKYSSSVRVQVYSSLCHLNLQSRNPLPILSRIADLAVLSFDRSYRKLRYEPYLVKSGNSSTLFD